jgi:hypothetical protein
MTFKNNRNLVFFLFFSFPFFVFSQVKTTAEKKIKSQKHKGIVNSNIQKTNANVEQKHYPLTISKKKGQDQIVHDEIFLKKELERIDKHQKAIDTKITYISSDSLEKKKAENEGWFEQMAKIKASLEEEKKVIMKELDSLK